MRHIKHLTGLIATLLLVAIFSPSPAQAQSFSVSPREVKIDNLPPGEEVEFNLTIHNKDNVSHTFILTTYNPDESQRRQGRDQFPHNSWVSFPQQVEVQAKSIKVVKVKVTIPSNQKWAGKDWEIWLGIKPETSDLLVVNHCIRLLVSTSGEVRGSRNVALVVGVVIGILFLGYGIYYSRRKAKPKHAHR